MSVPIDKLDCTRNLAMAIDDLMELEELMPEAERERIRDFRVQLETAHSAVIAMVERVKPAYRPRGRLAATTIWASSGGGR